MTTLLRCDRILEGTQLQCILPAFHDGLCSFVDETQELLALKLILEATKSYNGAAFDPANYPGNSYGRHRQRSHRMNRSTANERICGPGQLFQNQCSNLPDKQVQGFILQTRHYDTRMYKKCHVCGNYLTCRGGVMTHSPLTKDKAQALARRIVQIVDEADRRIFTLDNVVDDIAGILMETSHPKEGPNAAD